MGLEGVGPEDDDPGLARSHRIALLVAAESVWRRFIAHARSLRLLQGPRRETATLKLVEGMAGSVVCECGTAFRIGAWIRQAD
jgi:hypothetical protein